MENFIFGMLSTTEKRAGYLAERVEGVRHLHRLEPRAPRPGDEPLVVVTVCVPDEVEAVVCEVLLPETAVFPLRLADIRWDTLSWRYYQVWQGNLPAYPANTLVRYQIRAHLKNGRSSVLADNGAVFSYLVGDPAQPSWAESAVIYQIFPDRFYPGNGRSWQQTSDLNSICGGTLRGIIQKLDYIADLGFNTIWLNPFFPDHTHHGYHATDYFSVNPRLGTLDDIRELIQQAHSRHIRLILDFVANHWGSQHPTFQSARRDPHSPYHDWYHWEKWPHQYKTFFGVKDLPQLNVDNPAVRQHLFQSLQFWLGEIGFDGLRLDYVLGPSHDFWTELRQVAKQINPECWLFGEAVETPETQLSYEGRFDGCLDFILVQFLRETFATNTMPLSQFDAQLSMHEAFFPASFSRPSFLDNHDMDRFLFLAGNDRRKLQLAALCQFTLTGQPIIYNGTEVGVSQQTSMGTPGSQGMAECRQPMRWGDKQDKILLNYYRQLIHFRRRHPVLWQGTRQGLHVDDERGTYAYLRQNTQETILVALNLSEHTQSLQPLPNVSVNLPPVGGKAIVVGKWY